MEEIKKQIIDIIRGYQEDERSSTGITGEKIIYGFSDESIVEDIVNLIQTIFDPENQPNQLGIENPFKQQGYSEEDLKEAFSMGRINKSIKDFNQRFKNK